MTSTYAEVRLARELRALQEGVIDEPDMVEAEVPSGMGKAVPNALLERVSLERADEGVRRKALGDRLNDAPFQSSALEPKSRKSEPSVTSPASAMAFVLVPA